MNKTYLRNTKLYCVVSGNMMVPLEDCKDESGRTEVPLSRALTLL